MALYKIRAAVTVNVEIEIEAGDSDFAYAQFNNAISMGANLIDTPTDSFMVVDDSIDEISSISIEEV